MSDFKDFVNMLRGRAPSHEAKSVTITYTPADLPARYWPSSLDASTGALQDIVLRNELVFACLAAKATAAQDPMLRVEKAVTKNGKTTYEPVAGHPFRALIMRPNPMMSEADLMQAAIISWDVSNPRRFYCEKEYKSGSLIALHPLNPSAMKPRYSRANSRELIGYDWTEGGQKREYALDELLIRAAPAWYDPPPLAAALGSVNSDVAQTDFISAFFENGGVPSGFLKYGNQALNDTKREEIRQKWRAIYGNRNRGQHDIGVLDMNADWVKSGATLSDLDSETLRQVAESRICMVFGVPPLIVYAYVGLVRATYSNLKEALAGFWDITMSPAFKEWRDFYARALLPEFEDERAILSEQVRLSYDLSLVAALQDDVDALFNRAEKAFRAGAITLNQYRAMMGQEADAAGDYYLRLAAYAPYPAGMAPTVTSEDVLMGKPSTAAEPMKRRQIKKRDDLVSVERRMEKKLQTYLQQQYTLAANAVRG